jgi:tRNA pseudouridine55 synthase
MDGLLVVDKPIGPTSHDVVARVRRATGERSIGHTGTLDPGASGVLPLVLGRATRLARFLSASDKTYQAVIQLGVETDSDDAAGQPLGPAFAGVLPGRDAILRALDAFRGTFMQEPPIFSAKKIAGVRSYDIARRRARGAPAAPPAPPALPALPAAPALPALRAALPAPVSVTVHALELLAVDDGRVTLNVTASAGFYVRALAHDLGRLLGTGAHLAGLRRTRAGEWSIADAIPLAIVERDAAAVGDALIPPRRMLQRMPAVTLTMEGARRARHGRNLGPGDLAAPHLPAAADLIRLLDESGDLIGIAECADGVLHPAVVLM